MQFVVEVHTLSSCILYTYHRFLHHQPISIINMKRLLSVVLIIQLVSCIVAFSQLVLSSVKKVNLSRSSEKHHFHLFSSNDENNELVQEGQEEVDVIPTPETDKLQQQANEFSSEPETKRPLDSLVASLTRVEPGSENTPTMKVPLLGEIPADGSIVVLAPVAAIGVLGFIMSINIAVNSGDAIAQQIDQVTNVLSTPPAKKAVVSEGCRGLCSDQEQQLDSMRSFMQNFAAKK